MPFDQTASRRQFRKFLSASPLLLAGSSALAGEGPAAGVKLPDPIMWAPLRTDTLIKSPKEAINVFDFEPVARVNIPPAHFGYMASGIDDEPHVGRPVPGLPSRLGEAPGQFLQHLPVRAVCQLIPQGSDEVGRVSGPDERKRFEPAQFPGLPPAAHERVR